jgi:dipeptidyl-peptidase-4
MHVDEAAGRVLFTAGGRETGRDPYNRHIYSVGLDGSELKLLTPEDADHDPTSPLPATINPMMEMIIGYGAGADGVDPAGRWFVDVYGTVSEPPVSVLRDRDGKVLMTLETADVSDLRPTDIPAPEAFSVTALDGETPLYGVIYKPAGFDPSKSYPVIEVVYGGAQIAATPKSVRQGIFSTTAEPFAALGFVVVIVDGPGTPYRSHAFQRAVLGNIQSCGGLDDHKAAIETLAKTRPWMDLDRVGITGSSGGGYATVRALATYPEFYKVGVSSCGNHDQSGYIALWGETYHGPWSPELYADQANASVAANIVGDLLLIHGEMDDNVHPGHTIKVVNALIAANRDFDMLVIPNIGHGVMLHPYARRRSWDYFIDHLMERV